MKSILRLLAMTMAASIMLASCTGGDESSSTAESGGATGTDEPKTIKIMGSVDTQYWDTRENQPAYHAFKDMLKEVNLILEEEAVVKEQYAEVMKTRTATAMDLPDIISLSAPSGGEMDVATAINLGKSGIFLDVRSIVEEYSNGNVAALQKNFLPQFWSPATTEDGETFWFPCWYVATGSKEGETFSSIKTPLIRGDWLRKLGLDYPKNEIEVIETLERFRKEDVNESGKEDEVLIFDPEFEMFGPMFGLPADHVEVDIYDHTAKSPWLMKDQLIPYLEFLQTLTEKKILDVDSIDKPAEYKLQKIQSNVVSMQTGYAVTDFYSADVKLFGGSYEGFVFEATTAEELYVQGELPAFVFDRLAVTKEAKDLEAVARYFDVISTPEFATLHRYGIEGNGHTIEDGVLVPHPQLNEPDFAKAGNAVGHMLWPGIYGSLAIESWTSLRAPFKENEHVLNMGDNHSTGQHKYYYPGRYQLAIETQAEIDNSAEYWTDLETYMDETITKYAMGQYKIADIDAHINKMKELGLETMVADKQAQHDRFMASAE